MNHLTDKSRALESRLDQLEKLLENRAQEDYYISSIEMGPKTNAQWPSETKIFGSELTKLTL